MDLGLAGKKALITGGTKGIGRRCADLFAAEGAAVSVCGRSADDVSATVDALKAAGATAHGAAVDVADKAALEGWVADAAAALGGVDIVVANVSALAVADDEAAWKAGFDTDLMHTVRLVNAAMPHLEKSDAAAICAISSVSGREIDFTGPAYGAYKAALVHYTQGLAFKLADKGIRANAVSPGNTYFPGGIWNQIEEGNPELFASALALNPTGRMGKPEEIAAGVVFLCSPVSSFTTGTNLVIDGALTKGVQLQPAPAPPPARVPVERSALTTTLRCVTRNRPVRRGGFGVTLGATRTREHVNEAPLYDDAARWRQGERI